MRKRWLIFLIPWVLPALVVALQVRADGVDLRGPWQARWAGGEREVVLPAQFGRQGIKALELTLQRTVELPTVGPGAYLMVLGDLRSSVARVRVNGQVVGDLGAFESGDKADFNGLDAVQVPPGLLKPGPNELHLELRSTDAIYAGIMDRRLVLGPAASLAPWYLRTARLESWLRAAPLMVFGVLGVLLVVLAQLARETRQRTLTWRALAVVMSAAVYLVIQSGLGLTGVVSIPPRKALLFFTIVASVTVYYEFCLDYLKSMASKMVRLNRVVAAAAVVSGLVLLATNDDVYRVYVVWAFVLLAHLCVVGVQALRRRHNALTVLLVSTVFSFIGTGFADLLTDLGRWQLPRLFALSLSNAPTLLGAVVVGTFLALAEKNRLLTGSLRASNDELAQALVGAREATRVKSEFLANVSHELRTPLNSIINIPEGLLEEFESDAGGHTVFAGDASRTQRYLRTLHQSGLHLLGVVNQVLDFSKIEAGRLTLTLEDVPVRTLLDDVRGTLEPLATKRGISLEVAGELSGTLRADPVKAAQVLLNLGSNALKFSPDGARVEMRVERTATDLHFRVRDEGIGIAPENQGLIFEGFRQVEGGATRKFGGTGLGLAISRKLLELHGGTLTLQSEAGKGSTFIATFPLAPGSATSHQGRTVNEGRPCVVIIDDEPLVHETLRLALRTLPFELVAVVDPRRALDEIRRRRPRLVILDVMMPRLSGVTLLRELRNEPDLAQLPVLVLSAWSSNREVVEGLGARWLAKPWDNAELLSVATTMTSTSEPQPAGQPPRTSP
jgi:signal transduction histidine kinase/CheY-like chemotaxis protein